MNRYHCFAVVLYLLFAATAAVAQEKAQEMKWEFHDAKVGPVPKGWTADVTGSEAGKAPKWEVIRDDDHLVLAQLESEGAGGDYPVCLKDGSEFKDGAVSIRFKSISGSIDQAGGVVFRARDKDNFYIARANALENNVSIYVTKDGKRKTIKYWDDVPVPLGKWHELKVEVEGFTFKVYLNGKLVGEITDAEGIFADAGMVGFWTKADSVTYFDDLAIDDGEETAVRAYVTNFGGDGISVIDVADGKLVDHVKTGSKPHGVGIAPDGKAVYVSNEGDGTLSIIDPATNKVTDTIEVGAGLNQLAVSADGRHVFVTLHEDGAVAVVDVAKKQIAKVVPIGRLPHIALCSHDGKTIYVTCEGDMKLVALDAATWTITGETPLLAFPRVLATKADDSRIFQTIRWLNGALVIDPAKQKVVDRIALGEPTFASEGKDAHGLAVTPDGKELWLTTQTTNDVTFINAHDLSVLGRVDVGTDPNWVDFTPDGTLGVVSNTGSNDVSIVDVVTRKVVASVKVAASPKRLAVGRVVVK